MYFMGKEYNWTCLAHAEPTALTRLVFKSLACPTAIPRFHFATDQLFEKMTEEELRFEGNLSLKVISDAVRIRSKQRCIANSRVVQTDLICNTHAKVQNIITSPL